MKWTATDLPKLRRDLVEFLVKYGPGIYEGHIENGKQEVRPVGSPKEAGRAMAGFEVQRLTRAELFHVTEDMTDLVKVAAESLPDFTLLPQDLPAPYGLVYFGAPVHVIKYEQGPLPVVAISWGLSKNGPFRNGGVWITVYTDGGALVDHQVRSGQVSRENESALRLTTPALVLDNEGQIPFSELPISDDPRRGNTNAFLAKAIRSTWLLMSQTVASVAKAELSRAQRKQALRAHEEPPEVRVVSLRKRKAEHGEGDGSREYHHRWIVRGHWRQQWVPTISQHRPTWIAPHLKGPDGAPLLGGERVYSLRQ